MQASLPAIFGTHATSGVSWYWNRCTNPLNTAPSVYVDTIMVHWLPGRNVKTRSPPKRTMSQIFTSSRRFDQSHRIQPKFPRRLYTSARNYSFWRN